VLPPRGGGVFFCAGGGGGGAYREMSTEESVNRSPFRRLFCSFRVELERWWFLWPEARQDEGPLSLHPGLYGLPGLHECIFLQVTRAVGVLADPLAAEM
jgi:hypothetical protein